MGLYLPTLNLMFGSLETKLETANRLIRDHEEHIDAINNGAFNDTTTRKSRNKSLRRSKAMLVKLKNDREIWGKERLGEIFEEDLTLTLSSEEKERASYYKELWAEFDDWKKKKEERKRCIRNL